MNKLKYILSLSILFLNNNIISMEKAVDEQKDYDEQSLMLHLSDEVIMYIIELRSREYINNLDDIFTFDKEILKNKIEEIKELRSTSTRLRSLFHKSLTILKNLKQKKKDLSSNKLNLNQKLIEILNKGTKSKEDFKSAVKLILAGPMLMLKIKTVIQL